MLLAIMEQARQRGARAGEGGAVGAMGLAVALMALGASCFDGADALGLPCQGDDQCGNGQRCEEGFCGGPPATTPTGTSTGTSTGMGTSTTEGTTTDPTAAESTGPLPGCGNGLVEPELGEDCDPGTGLDTPECNAECTAATCGDGYVNAASGEQCDDANATALDDCTSDCTETLFWDDMEGPMSATQWSVVQPTWGERGDTFMLGTGWQYGFPETGTWHSGFYSTSSGTTRLISPSITFPAQAPPGTRFELRFRHRLRLDGNATDLNLECERPFHGDGGVVWVQEDGELRRVGPPPGQGQALINNGCNVLPTNPLYDPGEPVHAYAGISPPGFSDVIVPLPDVEGRTVELVFELGYDCSNCWPAPGPMGAGWTLDDVVVAAFAF